jgi:hypothetical protein
LGAKAHRLQAHLPLLGDRYLTQSGFLLSSGMSNTQINILGWILFIVSAVGFIIASVGSFWAMFGSIFFLLANLVFLIPYFRKKD